MDTIGDLIVKLHIDVPSPQQVGSFRTKQVTVIRMYHCAEAEAQAYVNRWASRNFGTCNLGLSFTWEVRKAMHIEERI
jgi:hypothetical protein